MIKFQCKCGRPLVARPEAAGKFARCPDCGELARIPREEAGARPSAPHQPRRFGVLHSATEAHPSPTGDMPARPCPKCYSSVPLEERFCSGCGLDLATGREYEPPKTALSSVGKIASRIGLSRFLWVAAIAAAILVGWMVYPRVLAWRIGLSRDEAEVFRRVSRGAVYLAIDVRLRDQGPGACPRDELVINFTDGERTAKEARDFLLAALSRTAAEHLAHARYRVVKEGEQPSSETFKLCLYVGIKWAYRGEAGEALPEKPHVASCAAYLAREGNVFFWKGPGGFRERVGSLPSPQDIDGIGRLPSAETDTNLSQHATRVASRVCREVFLGFPDRTAFALAVARDSTANRAAKGVLDEVGVRPWQSRARVLVERGNQHMITPLLTESSLSDRDRVRGSLRDLARRLALDPALRRSEAALREVRSKVRLVRLVLRKRPPKPELSRRVRFRYSDGEFSPEQSRERVFSAIEAKARERLKQSGYEVLPKGARKPAKCGEVPWVFVDVDLDWSGVAAAGGRTLPQKPFVRLCAACIARESGVFFHKCGQRETAPATEVSAKDAQRAGDLGPIPVRDSLSQYARKAADVVVRNVFKDMPTPTVLAELLATDRALEPEAREMLAWIFHAGRRDRGRIGPFKRFPWKKTDF